ARCCAFAYLLGFERGRKPARLGGLVGGRPPAATGSDPRRRRKRRNRPFRRGRRPVLSPDFRFRRNAAPRVRGQRAATVGGRTGAAGESPTVGRRSVLEGSC